jgi:hypothetical protein
MGGKGGPYIFDIPVVLDFARDLGSTESFADIA